MKNLILTLIITLPLTLWGQGFNFSIGHVFFPNKVEYTFDQQGNSLGDYPSKGGVFGSMNYESKVLKQLMSYSFTFISKQEPLIINDINYRTYFELGLSPVINGKNRIKLKPGLNYMFEKVMTFNPNNSTGFDYLSLSLDVEFFLFKNWFIEGKYTIPFKLSSEENYHPTTINKNSLVNIGIGYFLKNKMNKK